ncbi:hypothetical protein TWF281_009309 [Arthrobotrys megalospora]
MNFFNNLPVELQLEILRYLPWESHIPCMQVCGQWYSLLMSRGLRRKRYSEAHNPVCHRMFISDNESVIQVFRLEAVEDQITSLRLGFVPEVSNGLVNQPRPKKPDLWDMYSLPSTPDTLSGSTLNFGHEEDIITKYSTLPHHPILEDALVYKERSINIGPVEEISDTQHPSALPQNLRGIWLLVHPPVIGPRRGIERRHFDLKKYPEILDMSLGGFLQFIVKQVTSVEFLLDYWKIDLRLHLTTLIMPSSTIDLHALLDMVEWNDGTRDIRQQPRQQQQPAPARAQPRPWRFRTSRSSRIIQGQE